MSRNPDRQTRFCFKQFALNNARSAMKIGTDGVVLGGWVDIPHKRCDVLDVGSGTGLIGLMICQRQPLATVTAVEIDPVAEEEGRENFALSPFAGRIRSINIDFNRFDPGSTFDLIVSNPPFFTSELHSPDSSRATARHEGDLSVASLLRHGRDILSPDGSIAFIAPTDRDDEILFEASLQGYECLRRCRLVTVEGKAPRRTLWQFSPIGNQYEESVLTIKDRSGAFTPEYVEMLKEFYLNF